MLAYVGHQLTNVVGFLVSNNITVGNSVLDCNFFFVCVAFHYANGERDLKRHKHWLHHGNLIGVKYWLVNSYHVQQGAANVCDSVQ